MVAATVSMPMMCNSNDHWWTESRVNCDDWSIQLFAVDATDGSSAKCLRPNCFVVDSLLLRSAYAVSYHSVFCRGHCCRSSNRLPSSESRNSCHHCMSHWISYWASWHRWPKSVTAPCARRNHFVLIHHWLAIRHVDFDIIDIRPTAEKVGTQLESEISGIDWTLTSSGNLMLSEENSLGISEYRIMMCWS